MQNKPETLEKFYKQRNELKDELINEWQRRVKGLMDFYELQASDIKDEQLDLPPIAMAMIATTTAISRLNQPNSGKTGYSLYFSVRKAIEAMNGKSFTLGELMPLIEKIYENPARPSVSAILSRLGADKESGLKIVEPGSGKRASVYQWIEK
jgi:hypothetical protein